MPKVLCTLPNASTLISGVAFAAHANGMLSEDVTDDVASDFAAINGYSIVGAVSAEDKAAADAEAAAKAAAAVAEKADLAARAAAIDFKVKANWSIERLKSEVEAAEKAADEAKSAADADEAKAAAEAKAE